MVVSSAEKGQHVADLEKLFTTIAKYNLKLNPKKCVWGRSRKIPRVPAHSMGDRSELGQMCNNHREPCHGEGSTAADWANGRVVQVLISRRR